MTLLLPQALGFALALRYGVSPDCEVALLERQAPAGWRDVVYVLTVNGRVFRMGQTKNRLTDRINGYLKVMRPTASEALRPNEREDGRKLRAITEGHEFEVWAKRPQKILVDFIPNFELHISARCAEEDYLFRYYQPELSSY